MSWSQSPNRTNLTWTHQGGELTVSLISIHRNRYKGHAEYDIQVNVQYYVQCDNCHPSKKPGRHTGVSSYVTIKIGPRRKNSPRLTFQCMECKGDKVIIVMCPLFIIELLDTYFDKDEMRNWLVC